MQKPIQRVKFTKAIARHTKIRDQNPSLGYICPGEPHQRSPTLQNLRIGLRKRQKMAKNVLRIQGARKRNILRTFGKEVPASIKSST